MLSHVVLGIKHHTVTGLDWLWLCNLLNPKPRLSEVTKFMRLRLYHFNIPYNQIK